VETGVTVSDSSSAATIAGSIVIVEAARPA
jgi:hypothetical protein